MKIWQGHKDFTTWQGHKDFTTWQGHKDGFRSHIPFSDDVLVCLRCGCWVADSELHNQWCKPRLVNNYYEGEHHHD